MNKIIKYLLLCSFFLLKIATVRAQEVLAGNGDISTFLASNKPKALGVSEKIEKISSPLSKVKGNSIPVCDTVLDFNIVRVTSTSVKVQWKHTGHYAKSKYKLKWNANNGLGQYSGETAWLATQCSSDCSESYTVMGLTPNLSYDIIIVVECDFSMPTTSFSDQKSDNTNEVRTFTTPAKCDFSNVNLNIEPDYDRVTVLSTGFLGNVGDKLAEVELSLAGTNNLLATFTNDVKNSGVAMFANLQACQLYEVRARAKCKNPDATYSLGDWQVLPAKTKCCGEVSWASAPVATFNSITVKWYRSIYAPEQLFKLTIVDSRYQSRSVFVPANNLTATTQYPIETFTFNNLLENERYNVYVTPVCRCDASPAPTCSVSGGAIDVIATTADACAMPKSIQITNLQSNQLTVNLGTMATPRARKYTINLYDAANLNQPIASQELTAIPNSDAELRADFSGLLGGTAYKVIVLTACCNGAFDPNLSPTCNWGVPITNNTQEKDITTPTVTCTGIGAVQASDLTSHKATITWTSVAGRNYQIQLRKTAYVERDSIIEGTGSVISYTYYGLEALSSYSVKVVSLCCQSSNTPCSKWLPGEEAATTFKTTYILGPNCADTPTEFTLTPEADKIIVTWVSADNAAAMSATGRRFIVHYGGNPMQTRIITSPADATINGLTPGTKYTFKIREVFDGAYENYTIACDETEQAIQTLPPPTQCDPTFAVAFSCIGERYAVFQITQNPDAKDNNIRVYYRPVPTTENCDQVQVATPPSPLPDITASFMNKVFAGEEFYYLTDLQPCTAYEVYFETYKRNVNGAEELCKKTLMPQWYITKRSSSVDLEDKDQDGFPDGADGCDPVMTPKPKPKQVINLKDLICGDRIDPVDLSNLLPHTNGEVGDVWTINGFPFKVDDVKKLGNNQYNGTGSMSLPFNKSKKLNIAFDNISVVKGALPNTYYVSAGSIHGVKDGLPDLAKLISDINDKQKDAYKKFCQEPGYESGSSVNSKTGEKWDDRGFCQDKSYCKTPPYPGYINPTNYDRNRDPMGFDKEGNHVVTGTKYDECGCDAYGNDSPTQKCTPKCKPNYYWMAPDPKPTKEGQDYYNTVKSGLEAKIKAILASRLLTVEADLSVAIAACDVEIGKMDAARTTLGYTSAADKTLINGPNDGWIRTGMHKLFDKVPTSFKEMNTRKAGQDALEIAHGKLYSNDVTRLKQTFLKEIIIGLMSNVSITNLADVLGKRLMTLDKTAIADVKKDAGHPTQWLKAQIEIQINYEYAIKEKTGAVESEDDGTRLVEAKVKQTIPFANADQEPLQQFFKEEKKVETPQQMWEKQLAFEYEQGWQTVGGVDRALLLDEINNERLLANYFVTVTPSDGVGEPYPVLTNQNGRIQAVYMDDFVFTTTSAAANFYAVVETGKTQQIVFKAQGFKFTASGLDANSPIYLGLASNVKIPMNNALMLTLKGEVASSTTEPTKGTYVKFSCAKGFEGLQIDTDIEICNKYALPLLNDPSQNYPEDKTPNKFVTISTKAFFSSFNDI